MLIKVNETIAAIVEEAEKLDPLEQQILLTKLRVKKIKKKGLEVIAHFPKEIKKPTLRQIDKWKHASRIKE